MDPALLELLRATPTDQEVEAILRLTDPAVRLPGVRIVSRFGTIVTCRLPANHIPETHDRDEVASLKPARLLAPEFGAIPSDSEMRARPSDIRRPSDLRYTGRGCVVGFLDWGFAFGNASFRHADGRTRLLALWDQRRDDPRRPNHYGYGTIHEGAHLNAALATGDPYRSLGYHPADSDASHIGAHGTHVVDIAVGNGRGGGPMGLAPEADIVCVHLGTEAVGANPLLNLGDSVRVVEGISLVRRFAAGRPFVVSASIGRHGGPHDGTTLLDRAEEFLLETNPNALSVHSAGNYATRNCHAAGSLRRGEMRSLRLLIDRDDRTPNEVEIWYDRGARLSIRTESPDGEQSPWVDLGHRGEIVSSGRTVGRVYHRERDPQNDANLIDLFLDPGAAAGEWRLTLRADETPATGGPFHAWVERDDACGACQARFHPDDADSSVTTSTLANGTRTISVGAVSAHNPARPIAHFSSAGPTRDGRIKPDCVAPGVGVLAARSPWFDESDAKTIARRSGTSMAAPHVSGCAALLLEAGKGQFGDGELREIILSTVDAPAAGSETNRYGHGYLNVERAVAAAERIARRRETPAARSFMLYESSENQSMPTRQDTSARLLDLASQLVGETRNVNADELLRVVLEQIAGLDLSTPARRVYRVLRGGEQSVSRAIGHDALRVIARPLERLAEPIAPGDIIIRRAPGEGGLTHVAIVAGPELRRDQLAPAGLTPEDDEPGSYVQVVEGGFQRHGMSDRFARRVRDPSMQSMANQIVVRLTPRRESPVDEWGDWVSPVAARRDENPSEVSPDCYEIFSATTGTPPTIYFEFDLNYGASSSSPPTADVDYTLEYEKITTHRKSVDGFRLKGDGNRIELATKEFELTTAGRTEMRATMIKVLGAMTELQRACQGATANTLSYAAEIGSPRHFKPAFAEAGVASIFPLGMTTRSASKPYYRATCGVAAAPQTTFEVPLAKVDKLVDAIRTSEAQLEAGKALSGPPGWRQGVRSQALYDAQLAVNASRAEHIRRRTPLSGNRAVTATTFSPTLQGLLILMVSYLRSGELNTDHDYEVYAKGYLPINVKNPFRVLYSDLTPDEKAVFTEIYDSPRTKLFALAKPGATSADGDKRLFPDRVHAHQAFFFSRVPTWNDLVEMTVNDIPLKRDVDDFRGKKKGGHDVGCELLFAPLSGIKPYQRGSRRAMLELRRLGFNWVYAWGMKTDSRARPSWSEMTDLLFDLALQLNRP